MGDDFDDAGVASAGPDRPREVDREAPTCDITFGACVMRGLQQAWSPARVEDPMPALDARTAHVWRCTGAIVASALPDLYVLLSPDERARAARYRFACDAQRFIAARGRLRMLVAAYTGIAPDILQFVYSPTGKPALHGCVGDRTIHFNVSHSTDALQIAIALSPVGTDIEHRRPMPELDHLIEKVMSPPERNALDALPAAARARAFFDYWTRKEAYLKGTGRGLGAAPETITIAPRGCGPRCFAVADPSDESARSSWCILVLPTSGAVVASALAIGSSITQVIVHDVASGMTDALLCGGDGPMPSDHC